MESVIIVTPLKYDLALKSHIPAKYCVVETDSGSTVVDDGNTRIYIVHSDDVRNDLEPEQLATVTTSIPTPTFYTLDFSDIAFCREVLLAIADDPNILVDNDHGVLLPGSIFVRTLRSQPDWDWRADNV